MDYPDNDAGGTIVKQVMVEVHGGKRFTYRDVQQIDESDKFKPAIYGKEGGLTVINKWAVKHFGVSEGEKRAPLFSVN